MIQFVLDTNVFMSGIFWSGNPYRIIEAWKQEKIRLVTSSEIIEEYARVGEVLSKKYKSINISPFIKLAALNSILVTPYAEIEVLKPTIFVKRYLD